MAHGASFGPASSRSGRAPSSGHSWRVWYRTGQSQLKSFSSRTGAPPPNTSVLRPAGLLFHLVPSPCTEETTCTSVVVSIEICRSRSIPGATIGPATQTISLAARSLVSDVELTVFPAVFTASAGAAAGMLLAQTLGLGNYSVFGSVVTTCSIMPAPMTGPAGEMVHDVKARSKLPGASYRNPVRVKHTNLSWH